MASLNKVQLMGYVGDEPEAREIETGDKPIAVVVFSVATNARWKTKGGEQKERTDWHRVVAFRGLAETITKYVKKGAHLYIEGAIQNRNYEDEAGNTHYVTEIIASSFQFLDKKKEEEEKATKAAPKAKKAKAAPNENAIDPEDIPF